MPIIVRLEQALDVEADDAGTAFGRPRCFFVGVVWTSSIGGDPSEHLPQPRLVVGMVICKVLSQNWRTAEMSYFFERPVESKIKLV